MYVIEITPHPSDVDVLSLLLRFPAQVSLVGQMVADHLDRFACDEDADGPEPLTIKVEIKDMPLDEIVTTMVGGFDEHWRREIDAAIANGETCADWPIA
jgi:hypothetical protein